MELSKYFGVVVKSTQQIVYKIGSSIVKQFYHTHRTGTSLVILCLTKKAGTYKVS
jgi:hypothetical protein